MVMLFLCCCWWWWQIVKACHEYLYSKSKIFFLTLFLTCQPYQFDVTYATMTISRVRNWLLNTPSPKSLFHTLSDSFIKNECEREKTERKKGENIKCVCQPQYRPLGESPLHCLQSDSEDIKHSNHQPDEKEPR